MQNYRMNAVPYNTYRQSQMNYPMGRSDNWDDMPLATAYVPWQTWRDIYDAEKGFHCGTIFQELNKPFSGKRGNMR